MHDPRRRLGRLWAEEIAVRDDSFQVLQDVFPIVDEVRYAKFAAVISFLVSLKAEAQVIGRYPGALKEFTIREPRSGFSLHARPRLGHQPDAPLELSDQVWQHLEHPIAGRGGEHVFDGLAKERRIFAIRRIAGDDHTTDVDAQVHSSLPPRARGRQIFLRNAIFTAQ